MDVVHDWDIFWFDILKAHKILHKKSLFPNSKIIKRIEI